MKSSTEVKGIPCIFIYMKHDNCSSTNNTVISLQLYIYCSKHLRLATERGFREVCVTNSINSIKRIKKAMH